MLKTMTEVPPMIPSVFFFLATDKTDIYSPLYKNGNVGFMNV